MGVYGINNGFLNKLKGITNKNVSISKIDYLLYKNKSSFLNEPKSLKDLKRVKINSASKLPLNYEEFINIRINEYLNEIYSFKRDDHRCDSCEYSLFCKKENKDVVEEKYFKRNFDVLDAMNLTIPKLLFKENNFFKILIKKENAEKLNEIKNKYYENFSFLDVLAITAYFQNEFYFFSKNELEELVIKMINKDIAELYYFLIRLSKKTNFNYDLLISDYLKRKRSKGERKLINYINHLYEKLSSLTYNEFNANVMLLQNLIGDFSSVKLEKINKHERVKNVFDDVIKYEKLIDIFLKNKKMEIIKIENEESLQSKLKEIFIKERVNKKINLIFENKDDKDKFISFYKNIYKFNFVKNYSKKELINLVIIEDILKFVIKKEENYLEELKILTGLNELQIINKINLVKKEFNLKEIIKIFNLSNEINDFERKIVDLLIENKVNNEDLIIYLEYFTSFMFYELIDNKSNYNIYSIDEINVHFLEAINIIVSSKEELNFKDYLSIRIKMNFNKYILYKLLREARFNYFLIYDLKSETQINDYYHTFSYLINLLMLLK